MRVIVFFDLPTETADDKRQYRKFRKMLINPGAGQSVIDVVRSNKPKTGIVQILTVTEKQFSGIEYITGEENSEVIQNDERLIVL